MYGNQNRPESGGDAADDALLDELGICASKRAVLVVPFELLAWFEQLLEFEPENVTRRLDRTNNRTN